VRRIQPVVAGAIAAIRRVPLILRRLAAAPEAAPPGLVMATALLPSLVAGLILFRLMALALLAIAVAAALGAHVAVRLLRWPRPVQPGLAAVVGVALVGPGAPLTWAAAVAVRAAGLELARTRWAAGARLQAGVLAYGLLLLASRGAPAVYVSPGGTVPAAEPIRLWLQSGAGAQWPVDAVRLYVGNVAGPVFATSLLAVAIGAAWLWYSRRLSLLVVIAFGLGALLAIQASHWPAGYQLLSGPLWFVAALVLADRLVLPSSPVGRPLLGVTAGAVALAARTRGFAIEAAPVTVAALQLLVAAVQGAGWLNRNRAETRHRLRDLRNATQAVARLRGAGRSQPELTDSPRREVGTDLHR
jgi:hypothetical protein